MRRASPGTAHGFGTNWRVPIQSFSTRRTALRSELADRQLLMNNGFNISQHTGHSWAVVSSITTSTKVHRRHRFRSRYIKVGHGLYTPIDRSDGTMTADKFAESLNA